MGITPKGARLSPGGAMANCGVPLRHAVIGCDRTLREGESKRPTEQSAQWETADHRWIRHCRCAGRIHRFQFHPSTSNTVPPIVTQWSRHHHAAFALHHGHRLKTCLSPIRRLTCEAFVRSPGLETINSSYIAAERPLNLVTRNWGHPVGRGDAGGTNPTNASGKLGNLARNGRPACFIAALDLIQPRAPGEPALERYVPATCASNCCDAFQLS